MSTGLLAEIMMELSKWIHSFQSLVARDDGIDETGDVKILGLIWNVNRDTIRCDASSVVP